MLFHSWNDLILYHFYYNYSISNQITIILFGGQLEREKM